MEALLCLLICLLAYRAIHAGPLEGHVCELKPVERAAQMDVIYTLSNALKGCVSTGGPREVHVLNVKQSQEPNSPSKVELKKGSSLSQNPIIVINVKGLVVTFDPFPQDLEPTIYLPAGSFAMMDSQLLEAQSAALPTDSQELLHWAQATFGGVTSFAELQNPSAIRLTVGADDGRPSICSLHDGFSTMGFLEWDSVPQDMKSCQIFGEAGTREAHILQILDDPEDGSSRQTDIEVRTEPDCVLRGDQVLLFLQSESKREWAINSRYPLTVMVPEEHVITSPRPLSQEGVRPAPAPEHLIRLAQEKGFEKLWYTQMPSVRHVTLRLQNCESEGPMIIPAASTTPSTTEDPSSMVRELIANLLQLLQPWRCTSDSLSITVAKAYLQAAGGVHIQEITLQDPRCQAEQNDTHIFLTTSTDDCHTSKNRTAIRNQLLLTIDTLKEPVEVPFVCSPPAVDLQIYLDADFTSPSSSVEAEKKTYAEMLVSGAPSNAQVWIQECSLTPGSENSRILIARDTPKLPTVEVLEPVDADSTKRRYRFSFLYRAGAGLSACTGVLACELCLEPNDPTNCSNSKLIKTSVDLTITYPNPPGQGQRLGTSSVLGITFGAFLIGALLTAALWFIYSHTRSSARKQPVPEKPTGSESSSANQSIGSTQSTPCSTSSMA